MKIKKTPTIIAIVIILLIAIGIYSYSSYTTGEGDRAIISDVSATPQENTPEEANSIETSDLNPVSQKSFEFEGYSVGKSHVGTFDNYNISIVTENSQITYAEVIIQAESVNTGIGGLDNHLKSEDFFIVEQYPEITFTTSNIDYENSQAIGELSFIGITKQITIPLTIEGETISTDFFLDSEPFGMKYTGVNPEVRIAFSLTP